MGEYTWNPVFPDYFIGTGRLALIADTTASSTGLVAFDAGCRNNWHTHPVAQILVVTAGRGLYQEEGKPGRLFLPGDVVHTAAGVNHWHVATPTTAMSHVAITLKDAAGKAVDWGQPVTDEVFTAAAGRKTSFGGICTSFYLI